MRIIKKYSNRRMYDTEKSKVVTLEDIAKLIQNNEDVKVIDNSTGEDITTNVLLQTLLKIDQREDKDNKIKNLILKNLIKQYVEKPISIAKRLTLAGFGLADLTKRDFDKLLVYLVKQGKTSQKEGADFMRNVLDKAYSEIKKGAEDFAENVSKTLSKINKLVPNNDLKKKTSNNAKNEINNNNSKNSLENEKEKKDKIKKLEEEIKELKKQINSIKKENS